MAITKARDAEVVGMDIVTELRDSFGNRHIVQTALTAADFKHGEQVTADEAMMATNEAKIIANLKAAGKTDEQIEAMKK